MDNRPFKVPILLLGFNRPDSTRRVLAEIRKVRPEKLYIALDGPRTDRPTDAGLCQQTREIAREVDWPCEVRTLFRDTNHGCLMHIVPALDWFFSHVDRGIIFEDDCLPEPSFFPYCEELLEKYKDDAGVMHISGNNFQHDNPRFNCPDSYYFSRIPHCWGWATWKRAWNLYDADMKLWPQIKKEKKLEQVFSDSAVTHRWEYMFDHGYHEIRKVGMTARVDWDGRWVFACLTNSGACIMPRVNLVSNIGFNDSARVARNPQDILANLPTQPIEIPLLHPHRVIIDEKADAYTHKYILNINRYRSQQIQWFFKSRFSTLYLFAKNIYSSLKGAPPKRSAS